MYLLKLIALNLNLTAEEVIKLKFYCMFQGIIIKIHRKHLIDFTFDMIYNFYSINQFLDMFNSFKLIPLYFVTPDNLQKFKLSVFKSLMLEYFSSSVYSITERTVSTVKVVSCFTTLKSTALFFFTLNKFFLTNLLQLISINSKKFYLK